METRRTGLQTVYFRDGAAYLGIKHNDENDDTNRRRLKGNVLKLTTQQEDWQYFLKE